MTNGWNEVLIDVPNDQPVYVFILITLVKLAMLATPNDHTCTSLKVYVFSDEIC